MKKSYRKLVRNCCQSSTRWSVLERSFILISALMLWLAAVAKLLSVFSPLPALNQKDPVFMVRNHELLMTIAFIEFAVAAYCLWGKRHSVKLIAINYLAIGMLIYRILLAQSGLAEYSCPCLGNYGQRLRLDQSRLDLALRLTMWALISGSCLFLMIRTITARTGTQAGCISK